MSDQNEFIESQSPLKQNEALIKNHDDDNLMTPKSINENYSEKMKKIPDRKALPSDKNEMIKYLVERLNLAEDAINDAQETLISEQEKRKKLIKELEEKTKQLNDFVKNQNDSLETKVQNEFKKTLEAVVQSKFILENKKKEFENLAIERDNMNKQLENEILSLRTTLSHEKEINNKLILENTELKKYNEEIKLEKMNLLDENKEKDLSIKSLQIELEDAKGAISKLGDVQNVLNRILGSKEVFTKKEEMTLKINQSPNKVINQQDISISKQNMSSILENKPNYTKNDDDFWYQNNDTREDEDKNLLNVDQFLNKIGKGNNDSRPKFKDKFNPNESNNTMNNSGISNKKK